MASTVSGASTSEGSDCDPWSDEEDFCGDVAERYCNAITKLTPAIVGVLKNEIRTVLCKALSESLIGDDTYNTGITSHSDSQQQASQLLSTVKDQIRLKLSFYSTFLEILRSTAALQHVADRIAEEVAHLEKDQKETEKKTKQKKRKRVRKPAGSSAASSGTSVAAAGGSFCGRDCDDYDKTTDEGFQSESVCSAAVVGSDVAEMPPPDHVRSAKYGFEGKMEEPHQNQTGNSDITCDPQLEMVTPQQTSEGGEGGEGGGGGGADIHSDAQPEVEVSKETTTGENVGVGAGSVFVYRSQQKIGEPFESTKKTTQDIVAERNALQKRLEAMEAQLNREQAKHDKELSKKEEELSRRTAEIERKSRDVEVLKEAHKSEVKRLEEQHKEKMAKLSSGRQKIREEPKEEKREKQVQKQLEHLEEEKRKYKAEKERLELGYRDKIQKLEFVVEKERSEAKRREEYLNMREEKMDEIAALKEKIHELKERNVQAEAQTKICEVRMEVQREQMETQKERAEKALLEADLKKETVLKEQAEKVSKLLRSISSESNEGQSHMGCMRVCIYLCVCVFIIIVVSSALVLHLYHPMCS